MWVELLRLLALGIVLVSCSALYDCLQRGYGWVVISKLDEWCQKRRQQNR